LSKKDRDNLLIESNNYKVVLKSYGQDAVGTSFADYGFIVQVINKSSGWDFHPLAKLDSVVGVSFTDYGFIVSVQKNQMDEDFFHSLDLLITMSIEQLHNYWR